MGVYLAVIGIKDFQYRGYFNSYAYSWYNSWECMVIGALAMISSEVIFSLQTISAIFDSPLKIGFVAGADGNVLGKVLGN